MASLRKRENGIWEIQYRDEYRRRRTITLSATKYKERIAKELKNAVDVLVDKKVNNDPRQHLPTKTWVENAPPEIRTKLAQVGLYELPSTYTVKELWDAFLDEQSDVSEETRKTYLFAKDRFFKFFKPTEMLDELTQERIKEWKGFLLDAGYATATVAGTITKAKAVFNWAKRKHWISVSPLDGVGRGSYRNKAKDRFITQEEYRKLLGACPCPEWRVIITLARIGGLHPCEILVMRWADIDRSRHRFRAFNSKLKQHEDLYERDVPLFAEVSEELDKLRQVPGNEGQEYVINRYANREKSNLGTQFARIAQKAGIGKIPRPFDNMRASRSTEVYNKYGAKKESLWIGHSVRVAFEDYLMVTDDDYAVAAGKMVIVSVDKTEPDTLPEVTQK